MRFKLSFALLLIHLVYTGSLRAQLSRAALDSLCWQTASTFQVPGLAVAVVKDGKVVHAQGYGVRSIDHPLPVTEETLFGIASNSKAFTCVALAMMVDEGKLSWDDTVITYLPDFSLYDPYVTKSFTIKDLITHRSGLGLGAGDLLFFPEGGNHTGAEIVRRIKFLKQKSLYRSSFEYNNNMFIIAGLVLEKVSGLSWEDFIEQRIFKPCEMTYSKASFSRVAQNANRIDAHVPVNGKVVAIPHDWSEVANPAGGIMSNLIDMSKWASIVMDEFKLPSGKRLISESQQQQIFNMQNPIPVAPNHPYQTHFNGYGLGWFLSDVKGHFQITHTGGLLGTVTQFTVLPDLNLGIIVLTNQQNGAAFSAITNTIKDSYLGYEDRHWVSKYAERAKANVKSAQQVLDSVWKLATQQKWLTKDLGSTLIGKYHDDWLGAGIIAWKQNKLWISLLESPQLNGEMMAIDKDTWAVKWQNRSFDADAFLKIKRKTNGQIMGFTMTAISPLTDFSFDFDDLEFTRQEE